ncbi:MAG TPA: efflux RND transporter periplasmic adaptor subunit [Acidobacteriota bacterium]|nr:efflux RND transporter periplasmic adaptor subunit [Acidobacteriota bacterium]
MKRTLILTFSIIIISSAGAALFWSASSRAQMVRLASVEMAPLQSSVDTNGKVEADRVFELRSPVSGFCSFLEIHEGDRLKTGQAVARIDDASLASNMAAARAELEAAQVDLRNIRRGPAPEELNQAEADVARNSLELDNARKTLETNEWLLQRQAIARSEVDQGRRQVDLLKQALSAAITRRDDIKKRYDEVDRQRASLRVEAASARLKYLEDNSARSILRAPVGGTIYHFAVKAGAYVNTGDLVGLFADLSHLRVRAFVDEPDLGRISVGEQVIIQWDAHPKESWKGIVRFIPPEVVAHGSRSVAEVLCDIESREGSLIPNVNVDVEILTTPGPKVLSLPRDAVFPDGNEYFIWLMRDGRAEKRTVQTGRSTITRIEITGGISQGDKVIIPGGAAIIEGMRVQVPNE